MSLLGRVLARMGAFAEARKQLDRALLHAKAAYGERHLFVADALIGHAELAQLRADSNSAERLLREALTLLEEQYGPDHPVVQEIIAQLTQLNES